MQQPTPQHQVPPYHEVPPYQQAPPPPYQQAPPPPYQQAPPPPYQQGPPPPYQQAPVQPPPAQNPYGPPTSWAQNPPYGYGQTPGYPPPAGPYGYGYGYGYRQPGPVDSFGRPLATFWQRVGALLIDLVVTGIPGGIIVSIVANHTITTTVDPFSGASTTTVAAGFWVAWIAVIVAQIAYFAIMDGIGQTVGKRAVGIAVRSLTAGQVIGFGRALARWLIYTLLWWFFVIPGLLNVLSPLWDVRRQAWHDHAVGSVVVVTR